MDWSAFLFDAQHNRLGRLEYLSRRRFHDSVLADHAFEFALGKLQENDFARLNAFAHKSSADTFLVVVFKRLLEDFSVARFGKCRAPLWVQSLGTLWQVVYKRLCCERRDLAALAEQLSTPQTPAVFIVDIGKKIRAKIPSCGQAVHMQSLSAMESEMNEAAFADHNLLDGAYVLDNAQHKALLSTLAFALDMHQPSDAATPTPALLQTLQSTLDSDTHLLMKMVFQDDVSIPKAAFMLGIAEHTARRKIKHCLARWRSVLEQAGFDGG